jgi:hypothetical protein
MGLNAPLSHLNLPSSKLCYILYCIRMKQNAAMEEQGANTNDLLILSVPVFIIIKDNFINETQTGLSL